MKRAQIIKELKELLTDEYDANDYVELSKTKLIHKLIIIKSNILDSQIE